MENADHIKTKRLIYTDLLFYAFCYLFSVYCLGLALYKIHSYHFNLLLDVTIAFFDIAIFEIYLCGVCFSIIFSIATEQAGLSNYCCQFVNKTK